MLNGEISVVCVLCVLHLSSASTATSPTHLVYVLVLRTQQSTWWWLADGRSKRQAGCFKGSWARLVPCPCHVHVQSSPSPGSVRWLRRSSGLSPSRQARQALGARLPSTLFHRRKGKRSARMAMWRPVTIEVRNHWCAHVRGADTPREEARRLDYSLILSDRTRPHCGSGRRRQLNSVGSCGICSRRSPRCSHRELISQVLQLQKSIACRAGQAKQSSALANILDSASAQETISAISASAADEHRIKPGRGRWRPTDF